MILRNVLLGLALLGLTACASTGSGHIVQQKPQAAAVLSDVRAANEPYFDISLLGDIGKVTDVGVTLVEIPDPLPLYWKQELVDPSRSLKVKKGDKLVASPHLRFVFRVGIYRGEQLVALHEAVVGNDAKHLMVLLPPTAARDYQGMNLLILNHNATWGMTSRGQMVRLGKKPDLGPLPTGFFETNPSPLPPIAVLRRSDTEGKEAFSALESMFPLVFAVNGVLYSGRPNALQILAEFTPADRWKDRLITCGSAVVAVPFIVDPISLGVQAGRNMMAATRGCYRGDRY